MAENNFIENHDGHIYRWVMFYRETIEYFISAITHYESLLGKESSLIQNDEHLKKLLTDDVRREFKIGTSLDEASRFKKWLQKELDTNPDGYSIDISISHASVKYLKSVGFLYLDFLKHKRNKLSSNPDCTNNLLSAFDRSIIAIEETLNLNIFKKASITPLVIENHLDTTNFSSQPQQMPLAEITARPKFQLINTIEILDKELRHRCLDLFKQFQESGQSERHDTVIAEAARILENRLRLLTHTKDGSTALDLVAKAFDKKNTILIASCIKAEQQAAEMLFRGFFGYIRNQFQHKLISDTSPERVIQILGLVDYLLSLINSSTQATES